jgi:hypothetical protein
MDDNDEGVLLIDDYDYWEFDREDDYSTDEEDSDGNFLVKVFAQDPGKGRTHDIPMLDFWSNDPEFKNWEDYIADNRTVRNPDKNMDAVDAGRAETTVDIGQWCARREEAGTSSPLKNLLIGIANVVIKTIDSHPLALVDPVNYMTGLRSVHAGAVEEDDLYKTLARIVDWEQVLTRLNTREAAAMTHLIGELTSRLNQRRPTRLWVMDEKMQAFIDKTAERAERPLHDERIKQRKEKKKQQRNKSNRKEPTATDTSDGAYTSNAVDATSTPAGEEGAQKKCLPATQSHDTTQPAWEKPTPRSLQRVWSDRTNARGRTASTTLSALRKVPYSAESSKLVEPKLAEGRDDTVPHRRSERIRATHLQRDLVEVKDGGEAEEGDEESDEDDYCYG